MATHFVQSLLDCGSALDPREFLPKYAVKGNHTHFSFKGGYDEFCKYKGKWSFPDDAQVHRDLARVIEFLYERAANDEKHEFPYLIELKTQHSKFVQDLDIRAGDNFDITAFLVEAIFTMGLALVVLNVAVSDANAGNSFYGLAIGLTVTFGAIAGGAVATPTDGDAVERLLAHVVVGDLGLLVVLVLLLPLLRSAGAASSEPPPQQQQRRAGAAVGRNEPPRAPQRSASCHQAGGSG